MLDDMLSDEQPSDEQIRRLVDELPDLARENTDLSWVCAKEIIRLVRNAPYCRQQLSDWFTSSDGPVRDLAASVIEHADISSEEFELYSPSLMVQLSDSHLYARYRAALALFAHGAYSGYPQPALDLLMEASDNLDFESIANAYLTDFFYEKL